MVYNVKAVHNSKGVQDKRYTVSDRADLSDWLKVFIKYARAVLAEKHLDTVVYVNDIPIYHAGIDKQGSTLSDWEDNPVANYWKGRVRTEL